MHFKRRHYRSKTMKHCSICGSQRRLGPNPKYKERMRKIVIE